MDGDDGLPSNVLSNLEALTVENAKTLTIPQLKRVRSLVDEAILKCQEEVTKLEKQRNEMVKEIGNLVHDSVVISNDEVLFWEPV